MRKAAMLCEFLTAASINHTDIRHDYNIRCTRVIWRYSRSIIKQRKRRTREDLADAGDIVVRRYGGRVCFEQIYRIIDRRARFQPE